MDLKKLLAPFIGAVVFLFSAFGGFLTNIAPPEQVNSKYAVGLSSFCVLIILLLTSAMGRALPIEKYRRRWVRVGVLCFVLVLPTALLYSWTFNHFVYDFPPRSEGIPIVQHIAGLESDLTEETKSYIKNKLNGSYSPGILELNFPAERIWISGSISKAKIILLINYTVLILTLSSSIFCLLEASLGTKAKIKTPNNAPHLPPNQDTPKGKKTKN